MTPLHEAALKYASIGWAVIPLMPGSKTPLTAHAVRDASKDPNQINEWWTRWPNANIALACGAISGGIYVVDVDYDDAKGVNGYESLKAFPNLPQTISQATPRGGFHALYKSANYVVNRNNFRNGIDIRGDGYYIVLTPSVHPNGRCYSWYPGLCPGVIELAEFPAFLRPEEKPPWTKPVVQQPKPVVVPPDVLIRAKSYLAECEPAIQGNAGHEKLLWAASAMVHGFCLSDNQALELLVSDYNPRCCPPWELSIPKEYKDFTRKISEARRLSPRHGVGWLLSDIDYSDEPIIPIDIERLVFGVASQKIETAKLPTTEFEYLTQPIGLLGRLCSWINETSTRLQPFLTLGCCLVFLGVLFGRKIRDAKGSRTNLYCMGVSPSGYGKNHVMQQIRRLCFLAGCDSLIGGETISSDVAIESRLIEFPATMYMWDEIGCFFSHIRSGQEKNFAQVVSCLMKLYSAAQSTYRGKEYADRDKQRLIVQPCCGVYGASTPQRFAEGFSSAQLQDGWLGRCLVFYTGRELPAKRHGTEETPVPQDLIDDIKTWSERPVPLNEAAGNVGKLILGTNDAPPEPHIIPTDKQAEEHFRQFDDECTKHGYGTNYESLWLRAEENARRIALIVAAGNDFSNPVINKHIADYSCRLVNYLLDTFESVIAPEIVDTKIEKDKRTIIRYLDKRGIDGSTKGELTKNTSAMDISYRERLIRDLIQSGEIREVIATKTIRYYLSSHFAERKV